MITKVELKNFKRFNDKVIGLLPCKLSLIVGGNNVGKSTLLHALAVWEYCKTVLIYEKSSRSIYQGFRGAGYGIGIDDFTPLNIPSLKYLWTNLKPPASYSLSIKCCWIMNDNEKFIEIGLALTQERLFIKVLSSNVQEGERIPTIAYLPPFAGISDKEQWHSPAYRKKLIGQGLAGAVLRNTIMELFLENQRLRSEKKGSRSKIPQRDLNFIRENDAYEILNQVIFSIFKGVIETKPFNPDFHTNLRVDFAKGEIKSNGRFAPFKKYSKRDIMVEGSGFLQWLSVYTFAINPKIDVLLLDEPDAHLHTSLQTELIKKLQEISEKISKQILISSHSTEVIKNLPSNIILSIDGTNIKYLTNDSQKTKVLSGLGTEYFPKIDKLQKCKRVLFLENESDGNILKSLCNKLNLNWPENLVIWTFANNHKERKQIFLHLKSEIDGIKCISLEDRDNGLYEQTTISLFDKNYSNDIIETNNEFHYRRWRRWEIENYLISPPAIARLCNKTEDEINSFLSTNHGIIIHIQYLQSDKCTQIAPLFECEGKPIIESIEQVFGVNKFQIADEMNENEIYDDVKTLINEIIFFCQN